MRGALIVFRLWVVMLKRCTHTHKMHPTCTQTATRFTHWLIIVKKLIMLLFHCAFPVPSHLQCLITIIMQRVYAQQPEDMHAHKCTKHPLPPLTELKSEDGNKKKNIKHYILPKCCWCSYQLTQHWFTAPGRICKPQRLHTLMNTHYCVYVNTKIKFSGRKGYGMDWGCKNNKGIIPNCSKTIMFPSMFAYLCT